METENLSTVLCKHLIKQGTHFCRRSDFLSCSGHKALCCYFAASPGHSSHLCSARHTFAQVQQVQKGYDLSKCLEMYFILTKLANSFKTY